MARITLIIKDDLHKRALKQAEKEYRSLPSLVRIAIQEYLNKHKRVYLLQGEQDRNK